MIRRLELAFLTRGGNIGRVPSLDATVSAVNDMRGHGMEGLRIGAVFVAVEGIEDWVRVTDVPEIEIMKLNGGWELMLKKPEPEDTEPDDIWKLVAQLSSRASSIW